MSNSTRVLFEQGRYTEGLEIASRHQSPQDLPWLLGCAIFTGDWEQSQSLRRRVPEIPSLLAPTLYFEAIACLRRGEYKRARFLLKKNWSLRSRVLDREEEFFLDQGPALYYYFRGDFQKSLIFGARAFASADKNDFLWGELVSRDVLAHAHFHLGQVRMSFDIFEKVRDLSLKLKNSSLLSAVEISRTKYACQVGLWGKESIDRLEKSIRSLPPQDTYSRAEFLMELSRQHLLRGRLDLAESALKAVFPLVHRFQNKRQTARLNFRLAYLQFLRGQDLAALGILRSGMALLDPKVDASVLREMRGLESVIDSEPSPQVPPPSCFWQNRIEGRQTGQFGLLPLGEDLLGDLMDLLRQHPAQAAKIIRQEEYWGLLPKLLHIDRRSHAIVLGFFPKGLVLVASGEIRVKPVGLTSLSDRLLRALAMGPQSKENLIRIVWGYNYEPHRHDSLLHRILTRLRKLLSPFEDWIVFDGFSYRFAKDIHIQDGNMHLSSQSSPHPEAPAVIPQFEGRLNHRQNLFLQNWLPGNFVDIRQYARRFEISLPSATRDLTQLVRLGYAQKIGKARATRYARKA